VVTGIYRATGRRPSEFRCALTFKAQTNDVTVGSAATVNTIFFNKQAPPHEPQKPQKHISPSYIETLRDLARAWVTNNLI
jgi:hypothetical protein